MSSAGLRDTPGLTPHPSLQHLPKRFYNYIGRYIIISQQLDQCSLRIAEIVIIGSDGSVGSVGSVASVAGVRGILAALTRQLILDITSNHPGQLFPNSRNRVRLRNVEDRVGPVVGLAT